jgi:anti-sigma B factor antagonist
MSEQLMLRECFQDGVVVLTVSGELNLLTAAQLDRQLDGLARTGHHRIVLDLADLTFCDAYGIRVLVKEGNRARAHAGWLRLLAAGARIRLVLDVAHLTRLLPVFDTLDNALAGIAPAPGVADVATRR